MVRESPAPTFERPSRDAGYLSEVFVSFQGEGAYAGEEHLFLRFAGCPLRCRYCDTPGSLTRTARCQLRVPGQGEQLLANPLPAEALETHVAAALAARPSIQKLAITGGEPLLQWRFLCSFLPRVRSWRPVLIETAGVHPAWLEPLVEFVDVVSMDIKLLSNSGEGPFWDEHERFLQIACARDVYVKILADDATPEDEVAHAVALVHRVGAGIPVFLQPIHDADGKPTLSAPRLHALFARARDLHGPVRFLPQVHKLLGIP